MEYPKTIKAIKVHQPFGDFYVCALTAKDIIDLSFSDPLRYDEDKNLKGSQRKLDEKGRVRSITSYINGNDTAFPNSIIVSANYNEKGLIEEDENLTWKFNPSGSDNIYEVIIPTPTKLAAIIDGQHRVNGFKEASIERQKEMELLVAIYFDLPNPYQAYLFATINYNQKPVDKSLALEQFGYFTEVTESKTWSPELLAVHLSKKLNTENDSPFFNHIKVAPQNDEFLLSKKPKEMDWLVSTATIVDGVLKLISTNPKEDSNELRRLNEKDRNRTKISRNDNTPLRRFYIEGNDLFVYKIIFNFFKVVDVEIFKPVTGQTSYIKKTIGIQALFVILKEILNRNLDTDKNISQEYFKSYIDRFKTIDFTDNFYTASGIGKSRIQNSILLALEFKNFEDIRNEDHIPEYRRLLERN
ncbi:DGQHR domain-containing protein [uncultured Kordia sp.]|uniref:DGQHR domain-containing protein n=1 Tax=uncultured Kordia sp. TaxID=507699 RepID=UPI0026354149|nr:DGQHR domain-containing protein [uncultured Kordia sp.]